jgi:hypothetical protein
VVECLLNKDETLNSNPSTTKKPKKQQQPKIVLDLKGLID